MVELSSKELVKGLFQSRELPRVLFIPWVCSFAAKLDQVQPEEMLSDPGMLSSSLLNAQELFGYDAIVNVFDTTLEAEALGCEVEWDGEGSLPKVVSHPLEEGATLENLDTPDFEKRGRIPTIIESTKRIKIVRGKQVAVIGMITGPLTLAAHLAGNSFEDAFEKGSDEADKVVTAAARIALKLSKLYGEIGVDAIVLADEMLGRTSPDRCRSLAGLLKSIWNVTRYYGVHSLILPGICKPDLVQVILSLQADGIVMADGENAAMKEAAAKGKSCYGSAIPAAAFLGEPAQAAEAARGRLPSRGKGLFLSTEWDIPYAANVNAMHEIMDMIRNSD